MRFTAFMIGVVIGLIPAVGQIIAMIAAGNALSGNEGARTSAFFALGALVGTLGLGALFFLF